MKHLPKFESLYMGFTFSLLWVVKFGRASVTETRWNDIRAGLERELGCDVRVHVLSLPVLYAQGMENLIARLYGRWKYGRLKHCTGRTEFYQFPNLICFAAIGAWLWFSGDPAWLYKAGLFLILPIPIDAALIVLAIFAVQWAMIAGVFGGLIWFVLT